MRRFAAIMPTANTLLAALDLYEEGLEPHDVHEIYLGSAVNPTVFVPLTAEDLDKKFAALREHHSQLDGWSGEQMVRDWAAEAARMAREAGVDCEFAERFGYIRLKDDPEEEAEAAAAEGLRAIDCDNGRDQADDGALGVHPDRRHRIVSARWDHCAGERRGAAAGRCGRCRGAEERWTGAERPDGSAHSGGRFDGRADASHQPPHVGRAIGVGRGAARQERREAHGLQPFGAQQRNDTGHGRGA